MDGLCKGEWRIKTLGLSVWIVRTQHRTCWIEWGMKLLVFNAPSAMKKTMFGFGAAEASANAESPRTARMMNMIRRVR